MASGLLFGGSWLPYAKGTVSQLLGKKHPTNKEGRPKAAYLLLGSCAVYSTTFMVVAVELAERA